jgi:membrane dipeptidase
MPDSSAEQARRLLARALVWDNTFPFGPSCGSEAAHVAMLRRMRAAGYSCVSLTTASDNSDMPDAIRKIARDIALFRALGPDFLVVRGAEDIPRAKAEGKLAVVFTFQGTLPFERDIALVELYWRLGVRMALLAYNQRNHVADGCHEPADGGLSRFGIELVREMNRVGMLVDCSHTGYRSSMQAMEVATSPVVFSHSNPRALVDHERNIRDDQALACARTGGVVGVNGVSLFLGGPPDAPTLFRHLDHWVTLLGPEHVGIGLDVVSEPAALLALMGAKAADKYPAGQYATTPLFATPELLPAVAEEMLRRGWPEAAVEGVLGQNWLRVARQVWRQP